MVETLENSHERDSSGIVLSDTAHPEDRLDLLYRLIESGEIKSLADLQSQLETPTEKALIKCASLVDTFDETLFKDSLQFYPSIDFPTMSFAEFTRSSNLEEVPRTDRVFRVKDTVRQNALREWHNDLFSGDKAELIRTPFFKNLLSHYQNEDDLERLGVLVLTDPNVARTKFLKLFEAADNNFDLARCNDILKTLEDRKPLLTDELEDVCAEKRQYLTARNLFAPDYYQTVFYYARRSMVKAFDDLLKAAATPKKEWIFQLYAKGGMGKTMFVRWLLARHCVPLKIPIARLDFDFIHLPTAGRYPSLLVLAVADQLNKQIPGSPFDLFLTSYGHFVSLLRPPAGSATDDSRLSKEKQFQVLEPQFRDTIVRRFTDALNESGFKKNFVVVFDTLEEMSLHRKHSLLAVLKQLREIHAGYLQMRLLLSGRYKMEDRLPEFKRQFSKETISHELQPFTRREARSYLIEKRQLTKNSIVSAIVKKCETRAEPSAEVTKGLKQKAGSERSGSNPFKLSLFADLYQQQEVRTVKDILSYPSTDIEYLIERVVRRIKEPTVQWLLRYAAIPRQFTYEIFERVLAYHLEQELINQRQLDQVNSRFPKGAESFNEQENWRGFTRRRPKSLNVLAIWNDLRKYASGYSFISFDTGDDSAPRLQPDVVVPMRRLLEEQDIFKPLHEDAEKFFLQKAKNESDPTERAQHICESIYHRFQREGSRAVAYWRTQVESAQSRRHPEVRKTLAEEILGKDYVDDTGELIRRQTGETLIELEDLREGYLRAIEAGIAASANLKSNERAAKWEEISYRLEQLKKLPDRQPREVAYPAPFDARLLLQLASYLRETQANYKAAIPLLRQLIKTTVSEQGRLALNLQLADALAAQKNPEALAQYRRTLRLTRSAQFPPVKSSEVQLKMGQWYQLDRQDFLAAERTYKAALTTARKEKHRTAAENALRYRADVNVEMGLYDQAFRLLNQVRGSSYKEGRKPSLLDALLMSQIQARNLHQPLEALAGLESFLKTAHTIREQAALRELQGVLLGKLMHFEEALALLEEAKELWTTAANPECTDAARMLRIELQLFEVGNLHEAGSLLGVWEGLGTESNAELVCQLKLLRVFWAHRSGNPKQARRLWSKIVKDKKLATSRRSLVRILAAGVALDLGDRQTVRQFIKELRRVKPVSARLPLLTAFEFRHSTYIAKNSERLAITQLLSIRSRGKDLIPHVLLCADALVWCGASSVAKRHLDKAAVEALKQNNSFAYRKILRTMDRLNSSSSDEDLLSRSEFLKDFAAYPTLCAAASAEQAERFLNRENFAACGAALAVARKRLPEIGIAIHLDAYLDYLAGELERAEGKVAEAGKHFRSALAKYEKLGDKRSIETLQKVLPLMDRPVSHDTAVFALRMKSTPKSLSLESYRDDVQVYSSNVYATSVKPLSRIIKAEVKDRSAIYDFSKLLIGRSREIASGLGDILFFGKFAAPGQARSKEKMLPDFHLNSLSPAFAKMPWELATYKNKPLSSVCRYFYRSASQTVRNLQNTKWLQFALRDRDAPNIVPDGLLGRQTQSALESLRKKYKWPASLTGAALNTRIGELLIDGKGRRLTKALLIRPPDEQQRRMQSHIDRLGLSLDFLYEDNYFTILRPEPGIPLKEVWRKFQPDVIHIQSSFRETASTGQIYLDLGDEVLDMGSERSVPLPGLRHVSPSLLNDALESTRTTKLRPLVILDAICPKGITETIHQLVYRNAFAAELFQYGNVNAVIAMGLTPNQDLYDTQTEQLINNMSNTVTFGEIVKTLRKPTESRTLADRIATAGVALFANEPWLTVLSPEYH